MRSVGNLKETLKNIVEYSLIEAIWHKILSEDSKNEKNNVQELIELLHNKKNDYYLFVTSKLFLELASENPSRFLQLQNQFVRCFLKLAISNPDYLDTLKKYFTKATEENIYPIYQIQLSEILTEKLYIIFSSKAYFNLSEENEAKFKNKIAQLMPYCLPYFILVKNLDSSDDSADEESLDIEIKADGNLTIEPKIKQDSIQDEEFLFVSIFNLLEFNEQNKEFFKLMIDRWFFIHINCFNYDNNEEIISAYLELSGVLCREEDEMYLDLLEYFIEKVKKLSFDKEQQLPYNDELKEEILNSILSQAAEIGNLDKFNFLLNKNLPHEVSGSFENSNLLFNLIRDGKLEYVKAILEKKPELINQPFNKITPLAQAVLFEKVTVTNYLLSFPKIDVNQFSEVPEYTNSYSPFGFAIISQNSELIELLLKNKSVNKEIITLSGHSPLFGTIVSPNYDLFKKLTEEYNAKNNPNKAGTTPLSFCIERMIKLAQGEEKLAQSDQLTLFLTLLKIFSYALEKFDFLNSRETNLCEEFLKIVQNEAKTIQAKIPSDQLENFSSLFLQVCDKLNRYFDILSRKKLDENYNQFVAQIKANQEEKIKKEREAASLRARQILSPGFSADEEEEIKKRLSCIFEKENLSISFKMNFFYCYLTETQANALEKYLTDIVKIKSFFFSLNPNNSVRFTVKFHKKYFKDQFIKSLDDLQNFYIERKRIDSAKEKQEVNKTKQQNNQLNDKIDLPRPSAQSAQTQTAEIPQVKRKKHEPHETQKSKKEGEIRNKIEEKKRVRLEKKQARKKNLPTSKQKSEDRKKERSAQNKKATIRNPSQTSVQSHKNSVISSLPNSKDTNLTVAIAMDSRTSHQDTEKKEKNNENKFVINTQVISPPISLWNEIPSLPHFYLEPNKDDDGKNLTEIIKNDKSESLYSHNHNLLWSTKKSIPNATHQQDLSLMEEKKFKVN